MIEIAIVLAVIGLVIGGVFVATGSVIRANKENQLQQQIIAIVQNTRKVYANTSQFDAPTYAQAKQWEIYPADVIDTGTGFMNAFGGTIMLVQPADNSTFGIHLLNIPRSACVNLAINFAGNQSLVQQLGLRVFYRENPPIGIAWGNGVTLAEANTMCNLETGNYLVMDFTLRQPT